MLIVNFTLLNPEFVIVIVISRVINFYNFKLLKNFGNLGAKVA